MDKYTILVFFVIAGLLSVYFLLRFQIMELEREILEIKYFLGIERPPQTQPTISEELKISTLYIDNSTHARIIIKNTGTTEATINDVLINGTFPLNEGWSMDNPTLLPGDQKTIIVNAFYYNINKFESIILYNFTVKTESGGSYPASIRASLE